MEEITYLNARVATPNIKFKYDPVYGRLIEMQDGSGVTAYTYHAAGALGAGQLATVDGPLAEDTIGYAYDALGRVTRRSINGEANMETLEAYDLAGRLTSKLNALGRFTLGYHATHLQLETIQAPNGVPNGVQTRFEYQPVAGDFRLRKITHTALASPLAGVFNYSAGHEYTQSAAGEITRWNRTLREPLVSSTENWTLDYDRAGQLVSASSPEGAQQAWSYDAAGNRLSQQFGAGVSRGVVNGVNQLLRSEAGGQVLFSGQTDEPAVVRVRSNQSAEVTAQSGPENGFRAWVPVEPGTNTVRVTARDGAGNERSQNYQLEVPAVAAREFRYDRNGNTVWDGRRSYQWDGENRLVRIEYGDGSLTEMSYDGWGRRVRVEEKSGQGAVVSRQYVWAGGNQPAEERDGVRVTRRFFEEGEQVPGGPGEQSAKLYYSRDHLGSVREVTDQGGRLVCRTEYDFWGGVRRRSQYDGSGNRRESTEVVTVAGYTGHHEHRKSGLWLTWYRAYDPETGRWLSRDPIAEKGGLNLYGYVGNDPVNLNDPFGLWYWTNPATWGVGAYQGFNGGWGSWHGCPNADGGGDYWDRYLHYVDQYAINPGPAISAIGLGLWPKSLSPAGGFRGPLLGSNNPLTSVPRGFGFGGEWAETPAFRGVVSPAIGVATVGAGFWNIGIFVGGLGAAAGWY